MLQNVSDILRFAKHCYKAFLIAALFCHALPASASVTRNFAKAQSLFEKGQYRAAAQILSKQVEKYPDHKPSYFLLGRIYYASGNTVKAGRLFARAGSQFLTTETAFEYGISMFAVKRYKEAILGLKAVRRSSNEKGIADFYTGVAYFNLRRWYDADQYLRRAEEIPAELRPSRLRFIKETQRRIRSEQQSGFSAFTPQAVVPLPAPPPWQMAQPSYGTQPPPLPPGPSGPTGPSAGAPTKIEKPKTLKINQGFSAQITPKIEYGMSATYSDMHQSAIEENSTRGLSGGVQLAARYDRKPSSFLGAAFGGIQTNFRDKETTGRKTKFYKTAEDPDNTIVQDETNAPAQDRALTMDITGNLDLNFSKAMSAILGVSYWLNFPEFDASGSFSEIKPSVELSLDLGKFTVSGSAAVAMGSGTTTTPEPSNTTLLSSTLTLNLPILTVEGKALFSSVDNAGAAMTRSALGGFQDQLTLEGTIRKPISSVTLSAAVQSIFKNPPPDKIAPGISDQLKFNGSLNFSLDFGISVTGSVDYVMINQVIYDAIPTGVKDSEGKDETVPMAAAGDNIIYTGKLRFAPIEWAYFDGSFSFTQASYSPAGKAEHVPFFRQQVPDLQRTTSLLVGVQTTF